MKLSKLGRQIKREALGNPKKAGTLGLLLVVALYFWAPLVMKWLPKSESSTEQVASAASGLGQIDPAASPPTASLASETAETATMPTWTEINDWMKQDPTVRAVNFAAGGRNPFRPLAVEVALASPTEEDEPSDFVATPESLGLRLTGTVVGARRSVASINGRAYSVGETLEKIEKDGRFYEFELTEIYPRHVVLRREGEQFQLTIPDTKSPGRVELTSVSH